MYAIRITHLHIDNHKNFYSLLKKQNWLTLDCIHPITTIKIPQHGHTFKLIIITQNKTKLTAQETTLEYNKM